MEKSKENLEGITLLSLGGPFLQRIPSLNKPEYYLFHSISAMLVYLRDNYDVLFENDFEIKVLEGNFCSQKIALEDLASCRFLVKLWSKEKNNGKFRF